MKNNLDRLKLAFLILLAAGTLSYAQSAAQREQSSSNPPARGTEASKGELKVSDQELHNEVTDANKASKIIGMEVKNRENEKVGKVKDIVIDVQSGKVAYAVLSTGSFGSGKLIAVPLDALTLQPGEKNFVIDAPKDRIASAAGFADDNWPRIDAAQGDKTIGLSASTKETDSKNAKTDGGTTTQKKQRWPGGQFPQACRRESGV
jgi:sporulation protein YlmC with PRC-barrel domain